MRRTGGPWPPAPPCGGWPRLVEGALWGVAWFPPLLTTGAQLPPEGCTGQEGICPAGTDSTPPGHAHRPVDRLGLQVSASPPLLTQRPPRGWGLTGRQERGSGRLRGKMGMDGQAS